MQLELAQAAFQEGMGDRPASALADLEDNINFLKDGGTRDGIKITPLPDRFGADWDRMREKFALYKETVSSVSLQDYRDGHGVEEMDVIADELIRMSDALTSKLGRDADMLSTRIVWLDMSLAAANVLAHVVMVTFILRIFKKRADEKLTRERFSAIGELASVMAHDMKNPLGTIANSLTLLRRDRAEEEAAREMDRIGRSVRRMSHQIDGVLNYVRTVRLERETASLREILGMSLDAIPVPDNIRINMPGNDVEASCDPEKMEFVFANILLNAVQAIGGEQGSVTVKLEASPALAVVEFENSGPPIPAGDMPRIFEPLFTTRMRGTGLGLTSCRNIVEAHGGTISVEASPATFTIRIPKQEAGNGGPQEDPDSG